MLVDCSIMDVKLHLGNGERTCLLCRAANVVGFSAQTSFNDKSPQNSENNPLEAVNAHTEVCVNKMLV